MENDKLKEFRTIAVYGSVGAGKTALCFDLLEKLQGDRQIFFIKHPRPELLKPFGYINLNSFDMIASLNNAVIYLDEAQLPSGLSQYKREKILISLLSLARQRDLTLIISTSDSRAFTQKVEAYFEFWLVKDIEYKLVKQRSMIKMIIEENSLITPEEVRLQVNEFLAHSRKYPELNGRHSFSLPKGWSEALSKPFALSAITSTLNQSPENNCVKTVEKNDCEKKFDIDHFEIDSIEQEIEIE